KENPDEYIERSYESMYLHVKLMLELRDKGSITFDYGNNIRARALEYEDKNREVLKAPPLGGGGGMFPGFVPAYIRPFFCEGKVKAPIVIGRDHLDTGSVASPNRETESMLDGSDAVADWPILNALVNTAGGASWVSLHHGGGVGMGYSIHAGMVIVADGTDDA